MHLRNTDLNLLVTLDTLLDEAHVSRAAKRLGLSQPATSAALDRCRRLFDDVLLIRRKGGMTLTPRAERLHHQIKGVLAQLHEVLESTDDDLASIHQTVRLSMSDSIAAGLAPELYAHLSEVAPGIDLVFLPWAGPGAAQDELARGEVDLAISQFPQLGAGFIRRDLWEDEYQVLLRKGHPALEEFSLESWLAWPHVIVSGRGERETGLDQRLRAAGLGRRVAMVVPSFQLIFPILRDTDLVTIRPNSTPSALLDFYQLETRQVPFELPGYVVHMAWHRRLEHDRVTNYIAGYISKHYAADGPPPA